MVVSHNIPCGVHCLSVEQTTRQVFWMQRWVLAAQSPSDTHATQRCLSVSHTFDPQSPEAWQADAATQVLFTQSWPPKQSAFWTHWKQSPLVESQT
jgi:hypothetical protein